MMNRRLSKLRNEIAPQCKEDISYINSETIKNTVNNKLNSVPSERRIYMKQKQIKSIAVVFILVAAMATSVSAVCFLTEIRRKYRVMLKIPKRKFRTGILK